MDDVGFALLCFASTLAMVEPFGIIPIYVALTSGMPNRRARIVAVEAVIFATGVMLFFAFAGDFILRLFGISLNSLRIVGGIIIFSIGYEMLEAKLTKTAYDQDEQKAKNYGRDVALTPLAVPMLCGPGAIANVMLLWGQAENFFRRSIVVGASVTVMAISLAVLLGARPVMRVMGESGNKVFMRLMGLLTMAIAVEFFFAGLKPLVQEMLGKG